MLGEPSGGGRSGVLRETEHLEKVLGRLRPELCYHCMKCTSGCSAAKVSEYRPHLLVAMARFHLEDELVNRGMLWACTLCLKCKEYCPQEVAPVELNMALRNTAVERGVKPPEAVEEMVREVVDTGYSFEASPVLTRDFEEVSREQLGLPEVRGPSREGSFRRTVLALSNLRREVESSQA